MYRARGSVPVVRMLSAGRRRISVLGGAGCAATPAHPTPPPPFAATHAPPTPPPPFIATHAPRSPPPPFIAIHALHSPPPPFATTSSTQPCHTVPSQRRLRGHPAWRYDRRVDSFGTMNCGRSSSVEWKLPKLQRRVRFPSPAPPPPGRVPGGFVMPASRPPSTECGGTIGAKLSPRKLGARCPGTKLAQHTPRGGIFGIKLALLAQNGLILRVFLLLGEFCPVFVANKPSRANFLPHKPQHQHRIERNNTPTQHSKPRGETFTAPARHKQPKITHFHHAGANFLSQHPPPTQHAPTPGRTFFQPPASRPSQPTVACNSTPPHLTTTS